jgi:hypothetical protein
VDDTGAFFLSFSIVFSVWVPRVYVLFGLLRLWRRAWGSVGRSGRSKEVEGWMCYLTGGGGGFREILNAQNSGPK